EYAAASAAPHELGASGHELLREKDFAEMTPEEFERVRRLMAAIARTRPRRTSRRGSPDRGGERPARRGLPTSRRRSPDRRGDRLDLRRLCRSSLRSGGEPIEQPWKSRKSVPRK